MDRGSSDHKALHNKGNGLSERKVAKQLDIFRNTVSKYINMPEECVYDQTKLVVISETFRERNLNQRFHQYAKQNGLYGETFADWDDLDLERYFSDWLDNTANQRIHGSTGKQPQAYYEQAEKKPHVAVFNAILYANKAIRYSGDT